MEILPEKGLPYLATPAEKGSPYCGKISILSTLYNKSIFFFFFFMIFPLAKNERFGYLSLLGGDTDCFQATTTTTPVQFDF